jgi:hypothetical protein
MFRMKKTIAFLVLITTGCYTVLPITSSPPPAGTDLVLTLTDQGSSAMAAVIGPKSSGISGKYLGESSDSLYLGVSAVSQQDGNEQFWKGERVGVPRSAIATMRERKISMAKSALVAGAVVAALIGVSAAVSNGGAGSHSGTTVKGQ